MSYRIDKAKRLRNSISNLEQAIELNARALQYAKASKASKSSIEEFAAKDARLKKQLEKASKKYSKYADENLKVSDLQKVYGININASDLDDFDYEYEE